MKTLVSLLLAAVTFVAASSPITTGQCSVDQSQLEVDYGFWFDEVTPRWQEFVPTANCLCQVLVDLYYFEKAGDIIVAVQDSSGQSVATTVLPESQVTLGWNEVPFPASCILSPGHTYRLQLSTGSSSRLPERYFWRGKIASAYDLGVADPAPGWPSYDYAFSIGTSSGSLLGTCGHVSATCSAQSTECGVGTLGALVSFNGLEHVLSNNHVFNYGGNANLGDPVTNACTPCLEGQTIATFAGDIVPLSSSGTNVADCALARVVPGKLSATGEIAGIGVPCAEPQDAQFLMPVIKSGVTTGETTGRVLLTSATMIIRYPDPCGGPATPYTFVDQIVIGGINYAAPGDSGALVLEATTLRPVGLHFAGNSVGPISLGIANRIQNVIAEFATQGPFSLVGKACGGGEGRIDPFFAAAPPNPDVERAARFIREYGEGIVAIAGVEGCGVGLSSGPTAGVAIVLLLTDPTSSIGIPTEMAGFPVEYYTTGPFEMH